MRDFQIHATNNTILLSGECINDEFCLDGRCLSSFVLLDPDTGLMWQNPPGDGGYWKYFASYCESLVLEGYSDWRAPTVAELRTLIRGCPATEFGGPCTDGGSGGPEIACECPLYEGPAVGGAYWIADLVGNPMAHWSSQLEHSYENEEGIHYFAWYVDFECACFGVYPDFEGSASTRCVRGP